MYRAAEASHNKGRNPALSSIDSYTASHYKPSDFAVGDVKRKRGRNHDSEERIKACFPIGFPFEFFHDPIIEKYGFLLNRKKLFSKPTPFRTEQSIKHKNTASVRKTFAHNGFNSV